MSDTDENQTLRNTDSASGDALGPTPPASLDRPAALAAALTEITRAVTASLEVAHTFAVAAQETMRVLAHDVFIVLLLPSLPDNEPAGQLTTAFCQPPIAPPNQAWLVTDFSFAPALLLGQPTSVMDFAATAVAYPGDQMMRDQLGRSAVIVPLRDAPQVIGALILISRTAGRYHRADALLIEPIASLVTLALEHQRLEQQARALAVAEERGRLAREIHDTLAQSLTGIIINLEALKPYRKGRPPAEAEALAETETLARRALEEARRSVLGLHPTPLAHQSLVDALKSELTGLAGRAALTSQFYPQGEERLLTADVATAIFRIAQEAFQNIYKHAAAGHVILGLAFEADGVTLTIEDDGVGFVPDHLSFPDQDGFGLVSMAARARSLGGEFLISSHPGHGTSVRATLPYIRPGVVTAVLVLKNDPPPPAAPPIRVLVVDDHPIARQGIEGILKGQPDLQVVGEAEDGLAAVAETMRLRPDVVLLDLKLPRLSGIEALPLLRAAYPEVEVVVLTMFDQDEQVFACLRAGARGYVLKDAPPATLVEAVRAASQRQSSLPTALTTRVVERFSVLASQEGDIEALTERELAVLQRMAKGMPYKKIAQQLGVSANTVQYHVTNILQKLQVGNRSEAVAVAIKRGLLEQVQ